MDRTSVESKTLVSAGYDVGTRVLELEFRSGEIYRYAAVPKAIYQALLNADSKGQFFNQNIRSCFSHTRVLSAGS
jgi:KTSC domain